LTGVDSTKLITTCPRAGREFDLDAGASEDEDIRVYDDFDAVLLVVPPGHQVLAFSVGTMVLLDWP